MEQESASTSLQMKNLPSGKKENANSVRSFLFWFKKWWKCFVQKTEVTKIKTKLSNFNNVNWQVRTHLENTFFKIIFYLSMCQCNVCIFTNFCFCIQFLLSIIHNSLKLFSAWTALFPRSCWSTEHRLREEHAVSGPRNVVREVGLRVVEVVEVVEGFG